MTTNYFALIKGWEKKRFYSCFKGSNPTKKNYSQLEVEALVIIIAMKKYHKFSHGRVLSTPNDFRVQKAIPMHTAFQIQL